MVKTKKVAQTYSSQSQDRERGRLGYSVVALAMRIHEFLGGGASKEALKGGVYLSAEFKNHQRFSRMNDASFTVSFRILQ